jgi:hypothetical protein
MELSRVSSMSMVEVKEAITVTEAEWRQTDDDLDREMVEVRIDYLILDRDGYSTQGGRKLTFEPLQIRKRLLESLVTLGVDAQTAGKIGALRGKCDEHPIEVRSGVLAELLQFGLTPSEIWVFLLNHGGAKQTSVFLFNPGAREKFFVRKFDTDLDLKSQKTRFKQALDLCRRTARALEKVQRLTICPEYGLIPPLAPTATAQLIESLNLNAKQLEACLATLSELSKRPSETHSSAFCRDWYELATQRTGKPLYEQGAKLHSLLFRSKSGRQSFKTLCMQARKAVR